MKVALVHDYLTQRGGAERVFLSMCRAFPEAPIYTSLYEPELTFPEFRDFEIHTMPLNRVGLIRRHHRVALPLFATAFSRLEVDADVTICSSSGWAHGVRTTGAKVVYCHNPARWLYQQEQYTGPLGSVVGTAIRVAGRPLRRWDLLAARSADGYLANSGVVRQRVRDVYGVEADVLEPPIVIDREGSQTPRAGAAGGFFLCVSRLLRYKNVQAIVDAFARLPHERLIVVGSGPMERQLQSILPPNVELVGGISESELRWLYAHCEALIAASYEDFGLTPVEAMAFGKPSVVLRWGGFMETVIEGETGLFFGEPTGNAIADAVRKFQPMSFDQDGLKKRADEYSEERFGERLHAVAEQAVASAKLRGRRERGRTSEDQ